MGGLALGRVLTVRQQSAVYLRVYVLIYRTALGDAHHLHATADAENRHLSAAHGAVESQIVVVTVGRRHAALRYQPLAPEGGVDVAAAGQQQPVYTRGVVLYLRRAVGGDERATVE